MACKCKSKSGKKVVIISAPSGAGKTTIVKWLLTQMPQLAFSVSACSRSKRDGEIHGKDYYFISVEDFKQKIDDDELVEWQEVYKDSFYGTLKSEVERIWQLGKVVLFDVDVLGGMNIKKLYGNNALSIFIMPPSLEVLEERLKKRNTNSIDDIKQRLAKAEYELSFNKDFDVVVVNDKLDVAQAETYKVVEDFISK